MFYHLNDVKSLRHLSALGKDFPSGYKALLFSNQITILSMEYDKLARCIEQKVSKSKHILVCSRLTDRF